MTVEQKRNESNKAGLFKKGLFGIISNIINKSRGNIHFVASLAPETFKLETDWSRQAEHLADLYAQELNLTRNEYIGSLPKFGPQPKVYKEYKPYIPVIVETRVPLKRMLELLDIVNMLDLNSVKDWKEDSFNFDTPKQPHTTWLNYESSSDKPANLIRKTLKNYHRGGTIHDTLALYVRHPEQFNGKELGILGSQYLGNNFVPCIMPYSREGTMLLGARETNAIHPSLRQLIAGREINFKP